MKDRIPILAVAPVLAVLLPLLALAQQAIDKKTFRIKYVAEGAVYLDGGSAAGLKEGQSLVVRHAAPSPAPDPADSASAAPSGIVATLKVSSVAASSAVCEISSSTAPLKVGDTAQLAPEEVKTEQEQRKISSLRTYPVIVTFDTGDPVITEARASVPRPPSPEINRARGRIGFEYGSVIVHGNPASRNLELGMVARLDMTRIGGTYWNFSGYWRGRFTSLSGGAQPATLSDLLNRTYHLSLTYNNPESRLVAGAGRLYLPWASSLDTIDGGYFGRKFGEHTTLGIFAGTTPDPSSYDYNPDGKLAGSFLNFEKGSYEGLRFTTTLGIAVSALRWRAQRQFLFSETGIFFKRYFALYDSLQIDAPHTVVTTSTTSTGTVTTASSTGGINRSYLTLRFQPHPRLALDLSHTYFRDFPTFDPQLIGTGLLDRFLFQGLSAGTRIELPKRVGLYGSFGRSTRSGDTSSSWNQLYGLTLGNFLRTGLRADLRYSKFSSSFGSGNYRSLSLSRQFGESLRWELQGGFQNFASTLTTTTKSHFANSLIDWSPGKLFFLQSNYTWQRGGTMNYDQITFVAGRRF
jgi:hypothetical protein